MTSLSGTYRLDENGNEIKEEEEKPKVLPKKIKAAAKKKTAVKKKPAAHHKPGSKSLIKIKTAKKTVKPKLKSKTPAKKIEIHPKKKIPVIKPKIAAKKTAIKIKPIKVKAEASEQTVA